MADGPPITRALRCQVASAPSGERANYGEALLNYEAGGPGRIMEGKGFGGLWDWKEIWNLDSFERDRCDLLRMLQLGQYRICA